MLNRRQAVIGYITFRVVRRHVRRTAAHRLNGLRPDAHNEAGGGKMSKKTAGHRATTERAAAMVEMVRPIVTKAMSDPELHEALRHAFATGREVTSEISGNPPAKAARKLAKDQRLHKKVESSAAELQKAVSGLVEPPRKKRGRIRRTVRKLVVVGAVAGSVAVVLRKLRGGGRV